VKNLFGRCLISAFLIVGTSSLAAGEQLPDWWQPASATPGVKLSVHVESRQTAKTAHGPKKVVAIKFVPSGYPKDKRYELWASRLGGRTERVLELRVDEAGELRVLFPKARKPGVRLRDMPVRMGGFAKGVALHHALVSTDREVKTFAKFIPFPLEDEQGSCRVWLELVTRDGNIFVAQGEGFEPGEVVKTVSRSNGEVLRNEITATSDGLLPGVLLSPAAISRKHRASYSVTGRSCSVSVNYKWGPPALISQ
jgi:hypothetical protein